MKLLTTDHCISNLFAMVLVVSLSASSVFADVTGHWVFDEAHNQGQSIQDLAGTNPATITGPVIIETVANEQALLINRDQTLVELNYSPKSSTLPQKEITVEAWLAVDKTVEWGGIVTAVQEGSKQGWVLGFRQSNFSFGLAAEGTSNGKRSVTYTTDPLSLEWGEWYHVVGTYDGTTQRLYVNGKLRKETTAQAGPIAYPAKTRFLIGALVLDNFRWRGLIHEVRIHDQALDADAIKANFEKKRSLLPVTLPLKLSPSLVRLNAESVKVYWETKTPMPTSLVFGDTFPLTRTFGDTKLKTVHEVIVDGFDENTLCFYRITNGKTDGEKQTTRLFEFDTTFDYTPLNITAKPNAYVVDKHTAMYESSAEMFLNLSGAKLGYCLVLGSENGRLAYEIAKRSNLQVICVDDDPKRIETTRNALVRAGLYGARVSVMQGSLDDLPFPDYFANLIVSDRTLMNGELSGTMKEVYRVLRPVGGMAFIGQTKSAPAKLARQTLSQWIQTAEIPEEEVAISGRLAVIKRDVLPGSSSWTHMYGDMSSASSNTDERTDGSMSILWFGRPGPRPMMDRGTRPQAPLSINGRMFVQADRRLFGMDAYNGTILWTLEIPNMRRANVPRDSGNMTADETRLFVVVKDRCWVIDQQSGELVDTYLLPEENDNQADRRWGYIAQTDDLLLGSGVRPGSTYIGADGEWYDKSGQESYKVTSDYIFGMDRETGEQRWKYEGDGVIINSTIAGGDGFIYFVEGRNPEAKANDSGRMYEELQRNQYMVAVDLATGKRVWERAADLSEGRWVLYQAYAKNTLVVLSTTDKYHLFAFDAKDGSPLWKTEYPWYRDHHGGALGHPVIVGDTIYAEPKVFNLRSGESLDIIMPERNKCGTITASASSLFYRDFWHGMWDLEENTRVDWQGIRPGCWLNMIPANGIVLAPEASAGCFCALPIQASIAFYPNSDK